MFIGRRSSLGSLAVDFDFDHRTKVSSFEALMPRNSFHLFYFIFVKKLILLSSCKLTGNPQNKELVCRGQRKQAVVQMATVPGSIYLVYFDFALDCSAVVSHPLTRPATSTVIDFETSRQLNGQLQAFDTAAVKLLAPGQSEPDGFQLTLNPCSALRVSYISIFVKRIQFVFVHVGHVQ